MFVEYISQNWPLILILLAFVISLITTVFLKKQTIIRMYILIAIIFLLSIVVFIEFNVATTPELKDLRVVMMAIRYSATPFILALITFALVKRMRWFIFLPAIVQLILNIVSIFTGIVFGVEVASDNTLTLVRGPIALAYTPFIMVALYSILLIYLLIKRSNKSPTEIVYISFFAFGLASGVALPFILKEHYASMFCAIIAVALFAYFQFSVLQLTKKDSLTGLLNRHAYFSDVKHDPKSITSIISIDMNGLKEINDNVGHPGGDEAIVTLSTCIFKALKHREYGYRIGGDEFLVVCRKTNEERVLQLVENIRKNVSETEYTCSIGYSFGDGNKTVEELLKESDQMMYQEKEKFYLSNGNNRRRN